MKKQAKYGIIRLAAYYANARKGFTSGKSNNITKEVRKADEKSVFCLFCSPLALLRLAYAVCALLAFSARLALCARLPALSCRVAALPVAVALNRAAPYRAVEFKLRCGLRGAGAVLLPIPIRILFCPPFRL